MGDQRRNCNVYQESDKKNKELKTHVTFNLGGQAYFVEQHHKRL